MSLPNPAELLPRMASDLRAHLAERGIERPRFVGIHTGGIWVAEALLRELGNQEPLGTLDVSFYRDDFTQNGLHPQVRPSALPFEIDGQHLVLVDERADERPYHPRRTQRTVRLRPSGQRDPGLPARPERPGVAYPPRRGRPDPVPGSR